MHTHADGTRHHHHNDGHDHDGHGHDGHGHDGHDGSAPVVHNVVNHTVRGGPPVLDIGGDIGAMVVLMDAASAGSELFLRSEHEPPIDVHTGVWTRPDGTRDDHRRRLPRVAGGPVLGARRRRATTCVRS